MWAKAITPEDFLDQIIEIIGKPLERPGDYDEQTAQERENQEAYENSQLVDRGMYLS